ncbi:cell division protein FtsA [bacterium]|nr:cell division protein FtsA [bacterium]
MVALVKPKQDVIAVLDVGTTKVVCFIARMDPTGEPVIEGIGHQVSNGARSGVITDLKAAERSIVTAVHSAEQMAEMRIDKVVVNLSGNHIRSHNIFMETPVSPHAVSPRDVARLVDYGKQSIRHGERELVHCYPISYTLDEVRGIQDPVGMYGNRLGVNLHLVTASSSAMRNLSQCVARAQLDISEFVVSSFASGTACLTEDEMQLGVTLLDIGGGTSVIAVYIEGKPVFTDSIPVGAHHVTQDIARGLSTTVGHAERLKVLYGSVVGVMSDDRDLIDVPTISQGEEGGHETLQTMPRAQLTSIIRPRMEEIFDMAKARLEQSGFDRIAGRRLVLTGGGAQIMGAAEMAGKVFGKQARVGFPKAMKGLAESTSGPAFATAIGMVQAVSKRTQKPEVGEAQAPMLAQPIFSPVVRAFQWLREKI